MSIASFFLFLLSYTSLHHPDLPTSQSFLHNRRTLHQPFFPLTSTALPPSQPPSPSSTLPKYPSSSSTTSNSRPFFPLYPSPPPPPSPPATPLPTFPVNIRTLASPSRHSASKLALSIALPVLAVALLGFSLALFLLRRRRNRGSNKDARSDSLRFLPHDAAASDGGKRSAAPSSSGTSASASSKFLYLGTLVNSRGRTSESATSATATSQPAAGGGSPYGKLGSPELRPLPPLPRQFRSADGSSRSPSGEQYSPNANGRPVAGAALSSKQTSFGGETERSGSLSSTLSTPSNLSSNVASSPSRSSPPTSSLPPTRPPPPLLRQLTPSPPKRRPLSHSPPSSPPQEVENQKKLETLQAAGRSLWSPRKIGDFARNRFAVGRNPLAPPPLRPGYNDGQNSKMSSCQPPVLIPPKYIGVRSSSPVAVFPAESPKSSDVSEKGEPENIRPKLKPLHWDKVRASSGHAMVWDQLKSSSFQLNEEMIGTFVCNITNISMKEMKGNRLSPSLDHEERVLDPKKAQNIAIMLRALNVTQEEVCEALLKGKVDSISHELLEALAKMDLSKDEELKLKEYKDDKQINLDPAKSFLKAVLDVPFAFKRAVAMLYIKNFDSQVNHLKSLFGTLEAACEELGNNRMFHMLLGAVLKTRNLMNAQAFELDTLAKLVDIRGTDGKTSLLHSVVQEIVQAEGLGLSSSSTSVCGQMNMITDDECRKLVVQVISGLGDGLANVKKAALMDSEVLSSYVSKLARGIEKVQEVLRLNDAFSNDNSRLFHDAMIEFLKKAEGKLSDIQERESSVLSLVKETTEHFDGDSAKEKAPPFGVFMEVREFLAALYQVCKEVEKVNDTIKEHQFELPKHCFQCGPGLM